MTRTASPSPAGQGASWPRGGLVLLGTLLGVTLLGLAATPALADHDCSAPGQPPCSCGFLCYDCDFTLLVHLWQCSDADGWPAGCGGEGERACTVFEHLPSCKPGLAEIPFPGGTCIRLDADGFPPSCGGVNERACKLNEHIPSCKQGLIEERGVCRALDEDGYPTSCGGTDEPPCELVVQLQIGQPSCKACHVEVPLGVACRAIGADRFPSACGGCDQPACDLGVQAQTFQPACMPYLTDVAGTCRRLDAVGNRLPCAGLGEPDLATTVPAAAVPPGDPLWGFADLHAHPFANLGFGGMVLWGAPFHDEGIASALPHCDLACGFKAVDPLGRPIAPQRFPSPPGVPVHPLLGLNDLIGRAMSDDPDLLHDHGGYPEFGGWPRSTDQTHQQMYYRWIERAWRGGLRLMVANAVNNEVLCRVADRRRDFACEDMATVDRQIDAVKDLERYVDALHGGPGKGWFRIVRSSAAARAAVASGKLAVVLGIEVDSLFGCKVGSDCSVAGVRAALDAYHAKGVRHMFPIHLFDNEFGGTAIYFDFFNVGSAVLNGRFFGVADCSAQGFEFRLSDTTSPAAAFLLGAAESLLGLDLDIPAYPEGAHCNARGLTPLGESLVRLMMGRKVVVDVDHMSHRALDRTLDLAVEQGYPVVSGHSRFLEALADGPGEDEARAEYALEARHLDTIRALGGLVAPLLHQGHAADMRQTGAVANDCSNSTKTWAQAYLHAVDRMRGGPHHEAVGLGSDFNGGISPVGPRFGPKACAGDDPGDQGAGVSYPFASHGLPGSFDRMATGDLTFDYNTMGLANVGLLPDFIEDLKKVGLTDGDLVPLFSSAEAYIDLWARIEATSVYPPATTATFAPAPSAHGWNRDAVTVTLAASPHADGWPVRTLRYEASGTEPIAPTSVAGAVAQAAFAAEGETRLSFQAEDGYGNVEPERSVAVRIDRTPPTIALDRDAESYAVDATVSFVCTASDALSGVDVETCPEPQTRAYVFGAGEVSLSVTAKDRAGNTAGASTSFTVVVTLESLTNLTRELVTKKRPERSLVAILNALGRAADPAKRAALAARYKNKLAAQSGRALTAEHASILASFVNALVS